MLLPLAAAIFWSTSRSIQERETDFSDQAVSITTTSGAYLNEYFDSLDSMAAALVRHPAVRALRSEECDRLFEELLRDRPLIGNIVLHAPDGSIRGTGLPTPLELRTQPFAHVQQVVATDRPVVSELFVGQLTRRPTVVFAYPVHTEGGALAGVIGIGINLARLRTVFASIPLPERSVVTLTDRAGHVLARSLEPEKFIGTIVEHPVAPKDVPRTQTTMGLDGVERVFANAPIDRGDWLLSVGIPTEVAAARVRPMWRRNIVIVALALAGSFLASLWGASHVSIHMNRLRSAAQRIADGDLAPPVHSPAPNLEVAQLQSAFITMAANLRYSRDALDRQVEEERRVRETLQSLQRQVVRQERLAAVGLLVSGVAHELNNPLQAILGTAELLERRSGLSAQALDEVAFVKTQSGRAREIIRNLSRFSSQQSGLATPVDLRDVIAEVVQLRRRSLEIAGIDLDVELASSRPVSASFTELEQVTLNFVINAQQSIESSGPTKGRILIRLVDDGPKVRLEVVDNGAGVQPEDEPKLFQPFFTTKPAGRGTGLGLSVSYGIIESYGGSIGYRRSEWDGAVFYFELPAQMEAEEAAAGSTADDESTVLHRSILPGI